MIKFVLFSIMVMTMMLANAFAAEQTVPKKIALKQGFVQVYDYGAIRLHAYQTADPMVDECFLLETGKNLVGIESPPFNDTIVEWKKYIASLNKPLTDILISAHPGGGDWFGQARSHADAGAEKAITNGATKALTESLGKVFGKGFNTEMPRIDSTLKPGMNIIGGIRFLVIGAGDSYDIAIPEIQAIYTHMLGADTHSILAGPEHIRAVLASLESMKAEGYQLILSGHHTPESSADVDTKIAYVKKVKEVAAQSNDRKDFTARMKREYPNYNGLNYLDMTAGYLFRE